MKKRHVIWTAAGVCCAVLLSANTYIFARSETSPIQEIRVHTVKVEEATLKKKHTYKGTAVSEKVFLLYPKAGKDASEWLVQPGDTVTEGQELVAYSDPVLDAQLKEAEDELDEEGVKADYYSSLKTKLQGKLTGLDDEKDKALIEEISGQISEAELQESLASSRETALNGRITDLKDEIDDLKLESPLAGTIQSVDQHSDPSRPIITINSSGSLLIKLSLPPEDAALFAEGEEAELLISKREKASGTVLRKQLESSTARNIDIFLQTDKTDLFEGQPVSVKVYETLKEKTKFVPSSALIKIDKKDYVYVWSDGFLQKRNVKLGEKRSDKVEIVSGAVNGEWAVHMPSEAYYHHQRAINLTNVKPAVPKEKKKK